MYKQNQAVNGFPFAMVDRTTGWELDPGTESVQGYYIIDGGTQASLSSTPVHEGNGQFTVDVLAGEMNGAQIGLLFTHSEAVPVHFTIATTTKKVSELNDFDNSTDQVIVATNNDKSGYSINGTKTTLDALNDFDPATDEVDIGEVKGVAVTSVDDFKADATSILGSDGAIDANVISVNASSVQSIAAGVWDRLTSAVTAAGSMGAYILTKLGFITSETELQTNGLISSGDIITIYQGETATYNLFVDDGAYDLTGYTPKMGFTLLTTAVSGHYEYLEVTGTVVNAGVDGQYVTFDLAAAQTVIMVPSDSVTHFSTFNNSYSYRWTISAYLEDATGTEGDGDCPTLAQGKADVKARDTSCGEAAAASVITA